MTTYLGASASLGVEQLDEAAIADSEYLYIEGYLVTSPTGHAAAVRAREVADAAGVPVAVSFSDPGMVEHFPEQFREIIGDGVDLVFANDAEAKQWTGTDSLEGAAEKMRGTAKRFAITCGGEGAVCFDGKELHRIDAHPVIAVDSNGAGDMFAGAFLYALARGEDFATAGRFASFAAGIVVSQWGPRLDREHYGKLRDEFFCRGRLRAAGWRSAHHEDTMDKPKIKQTRSTSCCARRTSAPSTSSATLWIRRNCVTGTIAGGTCAT